MLGQGPLTASSLICIFGLILSFQHIPEPQDLKVQTRYSDTAARLPVCLEEYQVSGTGYIPQLARYPLDL